MRCIALCALIGCLAASPNVQAADFDKAALAWTLPWDADWVTAVSFIGPNRVAAGNNLGQILTWDLPEKAGGPIPSPVRRLDGHGNTITRLLLSPDGRWLISASNDHTIRLWETGAPASRQDQVVLNARVIAEAAAKKRKAPAPLEAKVEVQEAARILEGHRDWVVGMSLDRSGVTLASGDEKGEIIVWDFPAGKEQRRWKVKGWAYAVALAPDTTSLLVSERLPLVFDSGRHAGLKLWDPNTGQMKIDLGKTFDKQIISAAAYAPDGKTLAIARGGEVDGNNGKVTLLDPETGKVKKELSPGHLNGATDLIFSADSRHVISCGRDTTVRIWDVAEGKLVKELGKARGGQFKDWIHAVALSPDGRWLAAADMAGQVQVWSLKDNP